MLSAEVVVFGTAGKWSAVLSSSGRTKELCGVEPLASSYRMELLACVQALEALKVACEVQLHVANQAIRDAIDKGWVRQWRKRNWQPPPKHVDLWQRLCAQLERHSVRFLGVEGCAVKYGRCRSLVRSQDPAAQFWNCQQNWATPYSAEHRVVLAARGQRPMP